MNIKTCCFTGHRDIPQEKVPEIKKHLAHEIIHLISQNIIYYGAGGALGFDTLAALTVLELKKSYPQIKLILVLPCKEQTKGWDSDDIAIYEKILSQADKVVYVESHYIRGCMQKSNRHLVDNSGYCICYLTKDTGGTAYTVKYARGKGLKIISLI